VLVGGTLVYVTGLYMALPFETLFMTSTLDISASTAGIIVGVMGLAALPLQVPAGTIMDTLGRKPVLALAVVGSMLFVVGLAWVPQLFTPIVHETWRFCREEASSCAEATCIYAQRDSEGLRRLPLPA
jgi:MFS family permease